MEWQDTGAIISVRKHGESATIVDILTEQHGRHAGIVRGGASRKKAPLLQPGTQVNAEWRARLAEHLGIYTLEPLKSRTSILSNRLGLAALSALCALVNFAFPERMAVPRLYRKTIDLLDRLATKDDWLSDYALWEYALLEELGYGLDLMRCVATGETEDLIYVSPKSGCAVSRGAGSKWADKMLPLPDFLKSQTSTENMKDIQDGLKTTGYFLEHRMLPGLGHRFLPEARHRFIEALSRKERQNNEPIISKYQGAG